MSDGISYPAFGTEKVWCCVCTGSGKVPRRKWFRTKAVDCDVCEGTGEREIIMARNLSDADKAYVRASAVTGTLGLLRPAPLTFGDILGFSSRDLGGALNRFW